MPDVAENDETTGASGKTILADHCSIASVNRQQFSMLAILHEPL
jgi:hypothetical protein